MGPVLAECTDPLSPGIPDLRGLWVGVSDTGKRHVERIEQCADRLVVVSSGVTHDFPHADGTLKNGCHDWGAATVPKCIPIAAAGKFNATCMIMNPFKLSIKFTIVTRCLTKDGDLQFHWGSVHYVTMHRMNSSTVEDIVV